MSFEKKITFKIDADDNASSKLSKIGAAAKNLSNAYDSAGSAFSKFGSRFSTEIGLIEKTARLATTAVVGIGAALATAGVFAVKSAASFEQNRVAFETLLGSADKARELLKEISKFAKETPFELPDVVLGSQRLLAFGVAQEKVIPTFRKLGDIAMGNVAKMDSMVRMFGKVKSKGKADLEALNIAIDAGVPIISSLAKHFKTTENAIFDMVSNGEVNLKDFEATLDEMTQKGGLYYNGMIMQSTTLGGLTSNLLDSVGAFAREVIGINDQGDIREGSIFFNLKNGASNLYTYLEQNKETITRTVVDVVNNAIIKIKEWYESIGGAQGIQQKLTDLWTTLTTQVIPAIGNLVNAITPVIKFVADHAKGIMDLVIAYEAIKIILTTGQVIQAIMNFSAAIMAGGGANAAVTILTGSVGSMAGAGLVGALGLGLVAALIAVDAVLVNKAIKSINGMYDSVTGLRETTDDATTANDALQVKINGMDSGPLREQMQKLHDENAIGIKDAETLADRYDGIIGIWNSVIDKAKELIGKFKELASSSDNEGVKRILKADGGLVPEHLANGGLVYASGGLFSPKGTDTIPAMLTPGEMVLNKGQQNNLFNLLNRGGSSSGGQVFNFTFNGDISDKGQLINEIKQAINRELELSRYGIG